MRNSKISTIFSAIASLLSIKIVLSDTLHYLNSFPCDYEKINGVALAACFPKLINGKQEYVFYNYSVNDNDGNLYAYVGQMNVTIQHYGSNNTDCAGEYLYANTSTITVGIETEPCEVVGYETLYNSITSQPLGDMVDDGCVTATYATSTCDGYVTTYEWINLIGSPTSSCGQSCEIASNGTTVFTNQYYVYIPIITDDGYIRRKNWRIQVIIIASIAGALFLTAAWYLISSRKKRGDTEAAGERDLMMQGMGGGGGGTNNNSVQLSFSNGGGAAGAEEDGDGEADSESNNEDSSVVKSTLWKSKKKSSASPSSPSSRGEAVRRDDDV